jgi:hypothetical protein
MKRTIKRALFVLGMLLLPLPLFGQTTAVTATITDSDATAWANGTFTVTFVPNPTFSGQYQFNGAPMTTANKGPYQGVMNGSGAMAVTLPDNSFIAPSGTQWLFRLCPNASAVCTQITLPVTGASLNLTATFSAQVIPPRFAATGPGSYGYSDVEINVIPVPGGSYYSVTSNCTRVWSGSSFSCPVTGGTVTSFSSGNLSPLFTTSVATPNTTPSQSFAQISQAQNLVFASPNGSSGNPTFRNLVPADLPAGTGTVTSVTASSPITSSGGTTPNIACPTCVTSVNGTANQITSSGGTTPTLSISATFIAPGSIQATTSLTGTSVTDSGLTSGRCVQAGGGGLLGNAAGACANGTGFTQIQALQITSGICTTANSDAGSCSMGPFSWSSAFADTSYTIACMPTTITGTGTNPGIYHLEWNTKSTTQFSLRMRAGSNSAGGANTTAEIDCIGVHP